MYLLSLFWMFASTLVVGVKVSILAYSGLKRNIGVRYREAKLESGRWEVGVGFFIIAGVMPKAGFRNFTDM